MTNVSFHAACILSVTIRYFDTEIAWPYLTFILTYELEHLSDTFLPAIRILQYFLAETRRGIPNIQYTPEPTLHSLLVLLTFPNH